MTALPPQNALGQNDSTCTTGLGPNVARRAPRKRISAALVVVAALLAPAAASAQTTTVPPTDPTTTASTTATTTASTAGPTTRVAPLKTGKVGAKVVVYATPATTTPLATLVNGVNVKGRVVFTVIEDLGDWLKVNAPIRKNGGVGYVRAAEIDTQFVHPWRIDVQLSTRRLTVYRGSEIMDVETVAVGAPKTPTPIGRYYTVDLLKPKGSGTGAYGPFAYGISAFSAVYQRFGAGDGRIGIHGTNKPSLLGQAISNGCIRMSNDGITRLKEMLPLGVPVEIRA